MNASFFDRHPGIKDAVGIIVFVCLVLIGTLFINAFVFRSFNVEGPSMETTMFTGDRLIVNRIPATLSQLQNKSYVPDRGQIIVFKNPQFVPGLGDEYIVKRVIAFPGEHVILKDGKYSVCDRLNLNCFNPDDQNRSEPGDFTAGEVDTVVPDDSLFVSGDNRAEGFSKDSRNGLGMIPYYDIIGPVAVRIFPFNKIRTF